MAVFAHEENPLDEREWEHLKSVVIEVARRPVVKEDWHVDASEWILFTKAL